MSSAAASARREISIHALREEGDCCYQAGQDSVLISIHALREEGDGHSGAVLRGDTDFYPRPPRGGRPAGQRTAPMPCRFLSTPSARRATRAGVGQVAMESQFLSTPSARRATGAGHERGLAYAISIHALREEGDRRTAHAEHGVDDFYPRPPRGGRPLP